MRQSAGTRLISGIGLLLLVMAGCVTERDYGRGKCMEYAPGFFCWQGSMNCRTDDKGCRSCECAGAGDLRK